MNDPLGWIAVLDNPVVQIGSAGRRADNDGDDDSQSSLRNNA